MKPLMLRAFVSQIRTTTAELYQAEITWGILSCDLDIFYTLNSNNIFMSCVYLFDTGYVSL